MPAPVSGKKEDKSQCNRSTGGRGKHSVYKLYLGWQHFSSEKYRVVTVKKGGGTRLIEYKADEVQTVESIIRKGTQFFFPNRKSQLGDLDHMDLSLASFSGESLETFTDLEGKECTLQMYLKSHGLFSSQYHLYLRTKRRGESTKSPKNSEEAPDLLKQPKEANSLNEDEGHLEKCEKVLVKRMKLSKHLIKQELCIHSRVRHPNIIQLMAYTLDNNKLFMISELNDGRNLDDVIFSGEYDNISFEQKVYISRNIIQAIAYLHNQSPAIIHRDIKPENILVSSDLRRIRLCDLGISKLKTMNTMTTTLDGTSFQPGTPSYQAPEVLLDRKSGSIASDVWSLGCTITELFVEEPTWSIPEDADPVMYIVSCMREGKHPDAFCLLSSKFSANTNIIGMMFKVLSFEINKRPNAVEMLNAF